MVSYEPSAELESYIASVSLDFLEYGLYGYCKELELERQKDTRKAIMAVMKLYKKIELDDDEEYLLDVNPLERDVNEDLEGCIAYVTFTIGQDIRRKVNDMRYNFKCISYAMDKITDKNGGTIDLNQIVDDYYKYVEVLYE